MTAAIDAPPKDGPRNSPVWLFSAPVDLSVFLGSALFSLGLLAWGAHAGLLHSETPEWAWVSFVLLVDAAHVYTTAFRVYFDKREIVRRPLLYFGAPIAVLVLGAAIYSESSQIFWRVLAYMAVFHFVRQQYGWVVLYRGKAREPAGWERWVDALAIYLATIYPLVYWHAHLPLRFWWFLEDDFVAAPAIVADGMAPLYWLALGAYAAKAIWQWSQGRANPGKDVVVATTAVCWHVGIITFNSDYAFTVTNVIIHGVPYFALILWCMRSERSRRFAESSGEDGEDAADRRTPSTSVLRLLFVLVATVWLFAYLEELIWDRAIWQERAWLFGSSLEVSDLTKVWLVPLLATPQVTHYILDGFIWKRRSNPDLKL
ncbi:MAG: hypothetical protein QGG36_05700 [Pirellulaceae bacterium]|jgi:hypothetical protein|nr:hypothetical protein [Pirellulaceae bacterium]MDP7015270.1 hypothetical protein [Pirellulaceae bacterium]